MGVEREEVSGDDQYAMRMVRKNHDGSYHLHANDPNYGDLDTTEVLRPFSRFRKVILPEDVVVIASAEHSL